LLSILYGLGAALSWGAGDFTGGLAARRAGAYRSVFYGEVVGVFVLLVIVMIWGEPLLDQPTWLMSMFAGALGSIGLLLLYHSMTLGLMSIAAPVSALLAAALPVVVGAFTEGLPEYLTMIGFGFALFAVWMVSQGEKGVTNLFAHVADLKLPLLAGIGFGSYFVFMHEATRDGGIIWPMVASRLGGMHPCRPERPPRRSRGLECTVSRRDGIACMDLFARTPDAQPVDRHPFGPDRHCAHDPVSRVHTPVPKICGTLSSLQDGADFFRKLFWSL
jgi:uncharacterized membrane protein